MRRILPLLLMCLLTSPPLHAREGAPVETAAIERGTLTPTTLFIGTVAYPEVAEVAAEVEGRVLRVPVEEGDRVAAGEPLALLDDELLRTRRAALEAARAQAAAEAKKARLDAGRYATLHREGLVSEQEYDSYRYGSEALGKKVAALAAEVESVEAELRRKTVAAPFAGVVVERRVEAGEWAAEGGIVATVARDDAVEIVVSVPETILPLLPRGLAVEVETALGSLSGRVVAVVPRGDVRTRTFPVKIVAANNLGLLEGMEAQAALPSSPPVEGLLVPRDALASRDGRDALVLVVDGRAKTVPVEVTGYAGLRAGVAGAGLAEGALVVTKGNERLSDGQPVSVPGTGP